MSFVGSNILAGASGQGGGYEIERSLRFNSGDSAYLNRTPSSSGNRKTFTWAGWVKRSAFDDSYLFSVPDSSGHCSFMFNGNTLKLNPLTAGYGSFTSNALFRDPSSFYHIVLAYDSTLSTAADRIKLYVNGAQQTFSSYSAPTQNIDTPINNTVAHYISKHAAASNYANLYLADVHFIDGQALAPTDFGETDDNGVWQPKKFNGSYNYTPTLTYPAVYTSSTPVYGTVAGINSSSGVFSSTSYTGAGSIKVEFSPAISNVTHIKFNGGGYSVNAAFNIKVNGTVTHSNLTTNSSYAVRTETISSTNITSFEIVSASDGWALGDLQFSTDGSTFASPTGTPAVFTPGVNGFHLDFADNSSNAALGTDTSGNSNTWTVNNLIGLVPQPSSSFTWSGSLLSGQGGSGNAGGYSGSYFQVPAGTSSWDMHMETDSNTGWWFSDSTSQTATHPNQQSGNFVGHRNGNSTAATGGSGFGSGSPSMPSDAMDGDPRWYWTINRTTGAGTVKVGPSGTVYNFTVPTTGSVYFHVNAYGAYNYNLGYGDPSNQDSLVDTPTNGTQVDSGAGGEVVGNYATLNPLTLPGGGTLSNGNLKYLSGGAWNPTSATIGVSSGKWYWEYMFEGTNMESGITAHPNTENWIGNYQGSVGIGNYAEKYVNGTSFNPSGWSTIATGSIVGNELDLDNGTFRHYINGVVAPSYATESLDTSLTWFPAGSVYGSSSLTYNFGQRPFAYTAPSGYKALCTANLPDPTIEDGSQYFDIKLWNGNDTQRDITGLAFSPDFTWIKQRSGGASHSLMDTVRGATKNLLSNFNNAEGTEPLYLNAFLSDGFSIGASSIVNDASNTYVGWSWDAGNSDKTYTITVANPGSGNKFYADGALQPTLTLAEGSTYKFDQSDSTNATHPLRFSTSSDGTHAGGSEYTTGVTTVGTPGSAGAYTQIVIPSPAPVLYAYCANHSGMGFQVNTSDAAGYTIPAGAFNDTDYDRSKSWISLVTTSALSSSYNSYSATSKLGALDGKRSTSLYGVGSQSLTITFDASAFPSSDGPYTVEVENNQRAITLNGSQTGSPWPGQATGWQKFDPVSTITTIASAHASAAYGGMINRIKVNGKILADPTATPDNIPSISTQVLASPESGFSISKWAGNAAAATAAHGLNSTPLLYFVKSLDNNEDWEVQTTLIGTNALDKAVLNTSAASGISYDQVPTSHFIGRPSGDANGENMIAYCFAPVEGYSAMGSYTGNGSADGPFVYTGHSVAWIMIKRLDAADDWVVYDSARDTYNIGGRRLYPDLSNAENQNVSHYIDILSNGFKVRSPAGGMLNASGGNYIYMSFAENPFKTARAR